MNGIRWEEPPSKSTKWGRIAAELRGRPGEWAAVDVKANAHRAGQTALSIRRGVYAAMPEGAFEAVARVVDGEARVYARYVGGGGS